MDRTVVEAHLNRVPIEVRESVMELSTDARWAVYIALALGEEMYFNELKDTFGANPSEMDRILKSLVDGGLIAKKVRRLEDVGDRRRVHYTSTDYGKKMLNALCDVVLPPESLVRQYKPTSSDSENSCTMHTGTVNGSGETDPENWRFDRTPAGRDAFNTKPTITSAKQAETRV
ncbi:MAG TPA: winged helix-turn-helix transcriptional regulator [Methanosarcina sp.]|nr:winged helix-turn-helix transcriptional regulator [Methanosarcina sp.]